MAEASMRQELLEVLLKSASKSPPSRMLVSGLVCLLGLPAVPGKAGNGKRSLCSGSTLTGKLHYLLRGALAADGITLHMLFCPTALQPASWQEMQCIDDSIILTYLMCFVITLRLGCGHHGRSPFNADS